MAEDSKTPDKTVLPCKRDDLVITPFGDDAFVVKDPQLESYFQFGEREDFLLERLDGKHNPNEIKKSYSDKFKEELEPEDFSSFIKTLDQNGLLKNPNAKSDNSQPEVSRPQRRQSPLSYRIPLVDPDRFFGWLAPRISWFWSRTFVVFSAVCIALAVMTVILNHEALISHFHQPWRFSMTVGLVGTLLAITMLHEFGHGLTCKRHGGSVHELGLLFLFFMPCLYANVSDAWLIREKRSRLWVTFAGGYVEACLWAVAVFVWRVTVQDELVNYIAWMVICMSGVRIFFNFNPFLKLDGYYLLSDMLNIPNLRETSIMYVNSWLRYFLWGADRPTTHLRANVLIPYGLLCWCVSLLMMSLMAVHLTNLSMHYFGPIGITVGIVAGTVGMKGVFRGTNNGEIQNMFLLRHKRSIMWLCGIAVVGIGLCTIPMEKRANGTFQLRPGSRKEIRAPVAAFLREVQHDEGDLLSDTTKIGMLDVPDLESKIKNKQSELNEVDAKLRLLKVGTRKEELFEQEARVKRAKEWRNLAEADCRLAEKTFNDETVMLQEKSNQIKAEVQQAKLQFDRSIQLTRERIQSLQQHEEVEKKLTVANAVFNQVVAEQAAHESAGFAKAKEEIARREKELSDELGKLTLLQAGTRVEDIEAEEAARKRILGELDYLKEVKTKLPISTPIRGIVTTPRLKEKVGQYFGEGELICEIESLDNMQIEITLPEQEIANVSVGDKVELKVRALPFETLTTEVERIAPAAKDGELHSTVTVYCKINQSHAGVKPGMTGFARVHCGSQPVGQIMLDKVMKYIRTEFWW